MTMADDETRASSGDSDGFSAANVAITTIVVLVLMAVLAVLGYKSMESDGVWLQVDPTTPASPGTALPSVPEQPEPASSLVGMTEAEVRELYRACAGRRGGRRAEAVDHGSPGRAHQPVAA
ncbi:MAG: hypothetical protein V9E94_11165 [Microthrixaceae bacterium]